MVWMWKRGPGSEADNQGSAHSAPLARLLSVNYLMPEFEWQKYFMKIIVYTKIDRYEKLEFANGSNIAVDGNVFLHAVGSGKRRIDRFGK
jgi:hypothetical protein